MICSNQFPYKGMAPAMNDLLSGEIAVGFVNITAQVVALHRGGKIRILAVNAPARLEAVPDIPTTAEAGLPNFVSQTFFGVFAAAGTPERGARKGQPGDPEQVERHRVPEKAQRVGI